MQQFNLPAEFGYEELEKSAYYYKVKHDKWVACARASEGQFRDFVLDVIKIILYASLWLFIRIVWAVVIVLGWVYDFIEKVLTYGRDSAKLLILKRGKYVQARRLNHQTNQKGSRKTTQS